MITQAYFEDIQHHIKKELNKATNSIYIAVAWFTDSELFDILCRKAEDGVSVELMLMDDDINRGSGIDYTRLSAISFQQSAKQTISINRDANSRHTEKSVQALAGTSRQPNDEARTLRRTSRVWKISTAGENGNLMHNKFCVIDGETVINGSYNWTNRAKQNYESITVIYEATELAKQFITEFGNIKEKYFGADVDSLVIDYTKICMRLETLKNVILLEDKEDIIFQLGKLKSTVHRPQTTEEKNKQSTVHRPQSTATKSPQSSVDSPQENEFNTIQKIFKLVEKQNYGEAVKLINEFVSKFKTLTVYVDSEIMALRLEIKALEIQVSSLEDEKAEIEKLVHEFEIRYNNELGELIIKILKLRKEKLKEEAKKDETKKEEYKEAEEDYKNFNENYKINKDKKVIEITEEEKKELKTNYRKASKLCHPDVVADEFKEQAEQVFKDLKDAYDNNDLGKVNEILNNLEKGIFTEKSEKINEKAKLNAMAMSLRQKRDDIEIQLNSIKTSETYKTVSELTNWDEYFKEIKEKLDQELHDLQD